MKYISKKVVIPEWVSCHTYFFGKENSRTYISNEKKHAYVLLEGLASDMWKLIYDGVDETVLADWASKNGVSDQVDVFLDALAEQGLIVDRQKTDETTDAIYESLQEKASGEEEEKFISEMKDWLFANGFMYLLFFELTYRCDLKCVHCYNPKGSPEVELDFDLCKKAIDDAYECGCFHIVFSGGESTTHTHFYELVKYAREKHISVEIYTNGQRLARDLAFYRRVMKTYPYRIGISLYSTEEKTHEKVTSVAGSFAKTDALIRRLRKDNVNVQIKNFLLNFNCADCVKVKKWAEEIGATSVADLSLIPTIEGDKKTMQFLLTEDQLFALYVDPDSPLYVGTDRPEFDREKIKEDAPCYGGSSGLTVTPDGNVVICVSFPFSVGNLNRESVRDIWRAAMAKDPQSKLYQWLCVSIEDCSECYREEYCAFCRYCPGMGYLENGYLKKSDVQCMQAKVKKRAYDYLKNRG